MARHCTDCIYCELDPDAFPCNGCSDTHGNWFPKSADADEMLIVILQNQVYMMREISRLREELAKSKE